MLGRTPYEGFVGFFQTDSTTGEALFYLIESKFLKLGIELVDQCNDGAVNMRGCMKEVAARVQEVVS